MTSGSSFAPKDKHFKAFHAYDATKDRFSTLVKKSIKKEEKFLEEPLQFVSGETLDLHGNRDDSWFTGVFPRNCPGWKGVGPDGILYSMPQVSFEDGTVTREKLQAYFDNTWTLTEVLLASLQGKEGIA